MLLYLLSFHILAAKPIAYKIDYEPKNPEPNDSIYVYASVFDNDGLSEVSIHYQEEWIINYTNLSNELFTSLKYKKS